MDLALSMETSCAFFLDFLILFTTMRLSNRIDDTLARRAQNILESNSRTELTLEGAEEGERMRAQRRHEAYRQMAD